MSDADDYARLMEAFDALEDASPADRAVILDELRVRDPHLARSVEALRAASARGDAVLEDVLNLSVVLGANALRQEIDAPLTRPRQRSLPAEPGEMLGPYGLTDVLGQGGMGCVYRAVHVEIGREVAVKVLDARLSEDEQYVSRFLREAKIVAAIRHPSIVEVFDFIEIDAPRRVAFVMELLGGASLAKVVGERRLAIDECADLGLQLCSALEAVHGKGVVHRDLKPQNVMVVSSKVDSPSASLSIKLLDFGIAKVPDTLAMHQTMTGVMMGTPIYMAPEQFAAEPATPATDVYALGEILFEVMTGRALFAEHGLRLMRRKLSAAPPTLVLPEDLPGADDWRALLHACLRTDPSDRPSLESVRQALSSLRDATRGPPSSEVHPPKAAGPPGRLFKRTTRRLAGSLALLLGLGLCWAWPLALEAPPPSSNAPRSVDAEVAKPVSSVVGEPVPSPASARVSFPGVIAVQLPAVVYGEPAEINTPFVLGGAMGDQEALEIDSAWPDNPRSGPTCLRIGYGPAKGWAGLAWLHPAEDWGERPGGVDLRGATRLSFWARSDFEGLEIRIGFGLFMRDQGYFDSTHQEGGFRLTRAWKRYTFDLQGKDLSRIKSGFYFTLDAPGPSGRHAFYFDDIQYE
jgi:serine/threonine-protein kinase